MRSAARTGSRFKIISLKKSLAFLRTTVERHERSRVALAHLSPHYGDLHVLGEREETERVGNVFTALSYFCGSLGMRDAKFFDKIPERLRSVYRVQIFSLEILNDGKFKLREIALSLADDHGYLFQAGDPARPQTPLACDEFIDALQPALRLLDVGTADDQRL